VANQGIGASKHWIRKMKTSQTTNLPSPVLRAEASIHGKVQVRPKVVEAEVAFFVAEVIEVVEVEGVTETAEAATSAEEESRSWIDPCTRYFYFDKGFQPRHFGSSCPHCCRCC
jgi:hypothetical protein